MTTPPSAEELLQRNKDYARHHQIQPLIKERRTWGISPPKTFIVTCLDTRVIPEVFLNLKEGEATVARNAGGHIQKSLSDLLALDSLLTFENLFIIHHVDCGTTHFKDENIRALLAERVVEMKASIAKMEFGMIHDLEQSIMDDLGFVRDCRLIRQELRKAARGFLYDIKTGKLEEIV